MAIIILLVCLIAMFLNVGIVMGWGAGKKEVWICFALVFSVFIVFITELLSAFHLLGFTYILLAWSVIAILNILYLFTKSTALSNFVKDLKQHTRLTYISLTGFEKFIFFAVLILLILVFVQGIVYPPNNWDSMCYHMARIPNWISHRSLIPYPTHIVRQIYQPPFAEFAIMNLDVLNRSDYFSNTVQLFFLLLSLVTIAAIAGALGLNRQYQIIAVALGATIPEVVLQASSTQNDIVVSFFILSACYFAIKAIRNMMFKNYLFLGIAASLALLTKDTAYIYLAPVVLIFGITILARLFSAKNYTSFWYSIIIIFIVISINAQQFYRSYSVSKNILGTDQKDLHTYSNENMTPLLFLSSVVKNVGLHMGVMGTNRVANLADNVIFKIHAIAGIDVNNPGNNFGHTKYSSPRVYAAAHEDSAPNLIHFILAFISFILIGLYALKNKQSAGIKLLMLTIFLQGAIFCLYLKWQPWNTRLHTPMFMLSLVLICYAASINYRFKKVLTIIIPAIIFYAFIIVLHNATRPYINNNRPYFTSKMPIFDTRYKKYFANMPNSYPEYDDIVKNIQKLNYKNIGLMIGANTYEYPLFTKCYSREINPVSINVNNGTKNIKPVTNSVDCIVSTTVNHQFIDYNGKRFYNQSSKNKYIYLYK